MINDRKRGMSRRILKRSFAIVLIALGSYVVGYFFSSTSDAFLAAKKTIAESPLTQKELGSNIEIRLAPFGYELESTGDQGTAEFECNVSGEKGSGKAFVKLKKISAVWKVTDANLQIGLREVQLMP